MLFTKRIIQGMVIIFLVGGGSTPSPLIALTLSIYHIHKILQNLNYLLIITKYKEKGISKKLDSLEKNKELQGKENS